MNAAVANPPLQFAFTAEQQQFRDSIARFCRTHAPTARTRQQMASDTGLDRELWTGLCSELGLSGVQVPESLGGQGFGQVELGIVMEELGRANVCAPYLASSVLAANALVHAAAPAPRAEWLPQLCDGTQLATLAVAEADGHWDPHRTTVAARKTDRGWRLDGVKTYVLEGHVADLILVVARAPGSHDHEGLSLFGVRAGTPGLQVRALNSLDPTRRLARVAFTGAEALLLSEEGAAAPGLDRAMDESLAALSSEMVGGAQALLDATVSYAKMRIQFGRPIGSFQAIKHRLADLLLDVEFARSAAYRACEVAAEDPSPLREVASVAKALASDAFMLAAREAVQLHGGIGFTWEHDTHLYFKRAQSSSVLLGSAAEHRDRYVLSLAARTAGDRP